MISWTLVENFLEDGRENWVEHPSDCWVLSILWKGTDKVTSKTLPEWLIFLCVSNKVTWVKLNENIAERQNIPFEN